MASYVHRGAPSSSPSSTSATSDSTSSPVQPTQPAPSSIPVDVVAEAREHRRAQVRRAQRRYREKKKQERLREHKHHHQQQRQQQQQQQQRPTQHHTKASSKTDAEQSKPALSTHTSHSSGSGSSHSQRSPTDFFSPSTSRDSLDSTASAHLTASSASPSQSSASSGDIDLQSLLDDLPDESSLIPAPKCASTPAVRAQYQLASLLTGQRGFLAIHVFQDGKLGLDPLIGKSLSTVLSFPKAFYYNAVVLGFLEGYMVDCERDSPIAQVWEQRRFSGDYAPPILVPPEGRPPMPSSIDPTTERRRVELLASNPHMHPTQTQLTRTHNAAFDVLPWPAVRDSLILLCYQNAKYPEDVVARGGQIKADIMGLESNFLGEGTTFRIHGDDPLDPKNWELGELWAIKYLPQIAPIIGDAEVQRLINNTNRLRSNRGLGKLRIPNLNTNRSHKKQPRHHGDDRFTSVTDTDGTPGQMQADTVLPAESLGLKVWAVDISQWPKVRSSNAQLPPLLQSLFTNRDVGLRQRDTEKVMRYVREVDRTRALAALLLPRVMLLTLAQELGLASDVKWADVVIMRTAEGRPYLAWPELPTVVDFNISHDCNWVVMAFHLPQTPRSTPVPTSVAATEPIRAGVDVMSVSLPHYEESMNSFVETMEDTMTAPETSWVKQPMLAANTSASRDEAMHRLYDLWTYKEALTKNIGLGLGFDFKRIEVQLWNCKGSSRASRRVAAETPVLKLSQQPKGSAAAADHQDPHYVFTEIALPSSLEVSPPLSLPQAQEAGILKLWQMGELVAHAVNLARSTAWR